MRAVHRFVLAAFALTGVAFGARFDTGIAHAQGLEPGSAPMLMLPCGKAFDVRPHGRDAPPTVRAECPMWGDSRGLFAAPSGNGWSLEIGQGYFDHAQVVNPASLGAGALLRCHYRRNMQSMADARTGSRDEIVYVQLRNLGAGTDAARCRLSGRVVECRP